MIPSTLGIDIAKLKFDVCLLNMKGKLKHRVFPNTATGFSQRGEWLTKRRVERVHAGMEECVNNFV